MSLSTMFVREHYTVLMTYSKNVINNVISRLPGAGCDNVT